MLREVFRSDPLPYMKESEYTGGYPFGFNSHIAPPPYVEKLAWPAGFLIQRPPVVEADRIFVLGWMSTNYWSIGGGITEQFVFDGLTGKFLSRMVLGGVGLGEVFSWSKKVLPTRSGKTIHSLDYYETSLHKIALGATALALEGDEPKTPQKWYVIKYNDVQINTPPGAYKVDPAGGPGGPLFTFNTWAIDDVRPTNVLINGILSDLRVFEFPSGKFQYGIQMPGNIVSMCMADDDRCYILLGTRVLVLFDYIRGEVLGVAKIPPLAGTGPYGSSYWNNPYTFTTYDKAYNRILVMEMEKDNPDGSCATRIRGYSMVNAPARITKPIPLKVPRQGRTIPVLVQVVDDMNHGVGGFAVEAQVV